MNDIIISVAKPEDALGITTVLYKTWLVTYPNEELGITRGLIDESYKVHLTDEKIKQQQANITLQKPNYKRIVAKLGDQIVGTAVMIRHEDRNQLRSIYVLPEFQGKGIGKMLWSELKDFTDPSKDTYVEMVTYNQNAIEFYKKLGFVDTGKRMDDDKWTSAAGFALPEMEMVLKVNA